MGWFGDDSDQAQAYEQVTRPPHPIPLLPFPSLPFPFLSFPLLDLRTLGPWDL
jgi:hypothetical protein